MKKRLPNDECAAYIRRREEFENRGTRYGPTLKGYAHEPGTYCTKGHLPEKYWSLVEEATYVVYSYDTPIAWFGPEPIVTPASVETWLEGPGLDELERYLSGESNQPPTSTPFPLSEPHWQVPAVRYSRTTSTHHMGEVWAALAYEKTWREAEDGISVPAPHYAQTEYARTGYDRFERRSASTGGVRW